MKPKIILTTLFAAAFLLVYTGCKKDAAKPTATTTKATDYAAISSQVALTLYRSITGQYGGADISKGFVSPYTMRGGSRMAYAITPMCGLVTDTTYTYDTHTAPGTQGDIVTTYTGDLGFKYTCGDGTSINGYIVNETTGYHQQDFQSYFINNTMQQTDTVVALDQTYKRVSMNGTISVQAEELLIFQEEDSTLNASYKLSNLKVDFTSGTADITSGIATFTISNIPLHSRDLPFTPPPPYTGTIQYLGNHEAKLIIDPGYTFLVNLLTGVVTPD